MSDTRLDRKTYSEEFVWDDRALRYKYVDSGRYLSREAMLNLTRRQVEATKRDLQTIGKLLANGKISLETWQVTVAEALRSLHLRQALLARGGTDQMTQEDYLKIARTLKGEYKYLRNFAQDIADGKLSARQFAARQQLYSERSRVSFEVATQQNYRDRGYLYMQRFLGAADKHCPDCPRYSALGVQPVGTLPLPTEQCQCRANCKCSVRYYQSLAEAI